MNRDSVIREFFQIYLTSFHLHRFKLRTVILGAMAGAVFGLCCREATWAAEPVNSDLSPEARQVLDYLESTYQKQVLAG
jgi:hypothetical protein